MIKRRDFLKILLATSLAEFVDYEKLLWIPGEKKIFLPSSPSFISINQFVAIEMERITPKLRTLFERDNTFYKIMEKHHIKELPPDWYKIGDMK